MPTTPKGWPYPADSDTPDVPRDIKALAERLDAKQATAVAAGVIPTTAPASVPGGVGPVAVTFPAGLFTAAPTVVATVESTNVVPGFAMIASPSTTGFDVYRYQVAGPAGSRQVRWVAVQ